MKYKVKVGERLFEVEINNLHSQPVIALVDGEAIEVWLEDPALLRLGVKASLEQGLPVGASAQQATTFAPKPVKPAPASEAASRAVRFPIPGVIVSLTVRERDEVEAGQELCVLEAMKMKNVIRAPRAGTVAAVRVVSGQTVKHHDVLMEYAE